MCTVLGKYREKLVDKKIYTVKCISLLLYTAAHLDPAQYTDCYCEKIVWDYEIRVGYMQYIPPILVA